MYIDTHIYDNNMANVPMTAMSEGSQDDDSHKKFTT